MLRSLISLFIHVWLQGNSASTLCARQERAGLLAPEWSGILAGIMQVNVGAS